MNSVNGAFSFCMLRELIWRLKMDVIKKKYLLNALSLKRLASQITKIKKKRFECALISFTYL